MNPLITLPVRLLTVAFIVGGLGCVVLIPVVAFKFVSVLFEKDPLDDTGSADE